MSSARQFSPDKDEDDALRARVVEGHIRILLIERVGPAVVIISRIEVKDNISPCLFAIEPAIACEEALEALHILAEHSVHKFLVRAC